MLKWIKRFSLLILTLSAIIIGVTFTSENNQVISIVLFGYSLPALSVGLWVVLTLFVGAILGFLLSFLPSLWGQQIGKHKDKRIKRLESEVNRLRVAGIKGS